MLCRSCLHGDGLLLTHSLVLLKHFERVDERSVLGACGFIDATSLELLHASDHAVQPLFGHTGQHLLCLSTKRGRLAVG